LGGEVVVVKRSRDCLFSGALDQKEGTVKLEDSSDPWGTKDVILLVGCFLLGSFPFLRRGPICVVLLGGGVITR
jgi:hypothetical protein